MLLYNFFNEKVKERVYNMKKENICYAISTIFFCGTIILGASEYNGDSQIFAIVKFLSALVCIGICAAFAYLGDNIKENKKKEEDYQRYIEFRRDMRKHDDE